MRTLVGAGHFRQWFPVAAGVCSSPWQKSPAGAPEHRVHVVRRECDVTDLDVVEVGGISADLVDYPLRHLVFQMSVLVAWGFHRERVGVRTGGLLARRGHGRVVHGRDLHAQRRVVRDDAAAGVFPLPLSLFGCAEDADGRLHAGLVEEVVWRCEYGQAVEREVHLHKRGAVVAALEALNELGRKVIGANEFGEAGVR